MQRSCGLAVCTSLDEPTDVDLPPWIRLHKALLTTFACGTLLVLFAINSYTTALTKSATADEPLHLVGGFLHRHYGEFSMNVEDPPLFGTLFALPLPRSLLKVDLSSSEYRGITSDITHQLPVWWRTLYDTPGNDEQRALNRARFVGTMVGVSLGALIAWWSYRLSGSIAALIATAMFAFDPNFLGHASLVKNDVILTLCLCTLALAIWRVGVRAHGWNVLALAALPGLAMAVKFSGVMAVPILVAALIVRALLPEPWRLLRFDLRTRLARLLGAFGIALSCAVVSFVVIWAAYGFRFAPTHDRERLFDMKPLITMNQIKQAMLPHIRQQIARNDPNPINDF